MDKTLTIYYKGCAYSLSVISSTDRYPHFYWCLIDAPALIELFGGDCVAFKRKEDGVLYPADFYPARAQAQLDCVKTQLTGRYTQF